MKLTHLLSAAAIMAFGSAGFAVDLPQPPHPPSNPAPRPAPHPVLPEPRPFPPPVPSAPAPVYRFVLNGKHFFTLSRTEGYNAHFTYQGIAFNVQPEDLAGTHPIYRCFASAADDHFISVESNCEGSNIEGTLGYVWNTQVAGSHALYRCAGTNDHLETTNESDCTSIRYRVEGVLGYVR